MATTSTTPAPVTSAVAGGRDPWFDNAKAALVLLVVVGHAYVLLPQTVVVSHLYQFLYAWHVPAFVFVTGYLSRSFSWEGRRMWQLVRTVAVPYVLFECVLALFRIYVGGEDLQNVFRDPHWPMWYLSALFFWRLGTPIFQRLSTPVALAVAVGLSLAGGAIADQTFDFFRVCGFLPFFVLGLKATPEALERLRAPSARTAAVLVFLGIAVGTTWLDTFASTDWLYYSYGYQTLGVSDAHGIAIRSALLVVGLLGALAFFALVPRTGGWFTTMGSATLVVYLFHGFVIKGLEYAGYGGWADTHAAVALLLTTAWSAALALFLAWSPVSSVLTHVVDPFGYAETHVKQAVALTEAPAHAEAVAEAVEEAIEVAPEAATAVR